MKGCEGNLMDISAAEGLVDLALRLALCRYQERCSISHQIDVTSCLVGGYIPLYVLPGGACFF